MSVQLHNAVITAKLHSKYRLTLSQHEAELCCHTS